MTRILQQKTDGFDSSNLNKKTQEVFNTTIKIGNQKLPNNIPINTPRNDLFFQN